MAGIPGILPQTPLSQLQAQAATQQSPMVPMSAQGGVQNVQQNTSQWAKAIDLITQPGITSSLLQFGSQAVQPRAPGQSHFGQIGKAALGTMQGQVGLQENQRREAVAQSEMDTRERRTVVDEKEQKRREASDERAEKIRLEEKPLKDRLTEATIKYREAMAANAGRSTKGAQLQLTEALADALYTTNPEKYASRADAFKEAFQETKSSANKTPRQMKADFVELFLGNTVDPNEEEITAAIQLAEETVSRIFAEDSGQSGVAPPVEATQQEREARIMQAQQFALSQDPNDPQIAAQYDSHFGPGAYAQLHAQSAAQQAPQQMAPQQAAPPRTQSGRNAR